MERPIALAGGAKQCVICAVPDRPDTDRQSFVFDSGSMVQPRQMQRSFQKSASAMRTIRVMAARPGMRSILEPRLGNVRCEPKLPIPMSGMEAGYQAYAGIASREAEKATLASRLGGKPNFLE
jgi:hypothetical protein